jgi:hypothetical protein
VPASYPNRRARGESREGNGGGGLGAARRKENGRERGARVRHGSMDHEVRMALGSAVRGSSACSRRRRAGEQGGWRGTGEAMRLTGGAGQQRCPVSVVTCGRERGKRGSVTAGRRQEGPASTVSGGAV